MQNAIENAKQIEIILKKCQILKLKLRANG
jgi:hypothetical protein